MLRASILANWCAMMAVLSSQARQRSHTGKLAIREMLDVLYTEGASDVSIPSDAIEANTTYYVRWSPQGGSVGDCALPVMPARVGASIQRLTDSAIRCFIGGVQDAVRHQVHYRVIGELRGKKR